MHDMPELTEIKINQIYSGYFFLLQLITVKELNIETFV